jgi:hypothetical protein
MSRAGTLLWFARDEHLRDVVRLDRLDDEPDFGEARRPRSSSM